MVLRVAESQACDQPARRDFLDEDELYEEQTSEVAAEADGLRRAIKGEFDAWLLISEARQELHLSMLNPSLGWSC